MAGRGIPVACEVDLYGAVSEYMLQCASGMPATLLDINNSVPKDILKGAKLNGVPPKDLFMGFHFGNTCSSCMKNCSLKLLGVEDINTPLPESVKYPHENPFA